MNIKRAKQEIKDTIEAYLLKDETGAYAIPSVRQRPVLLIGPPGVGKTQIMEQISREMGIGLVAYTITHHTRQSAVGLPFIEHKMYGGKEYAVTEYTMSEIVASVYDKIEESGLQEGILFLDEINCVSETLAPAMLQFLQCKTFGTHRIPDGWLIAAAGNPPEYNKSVREFDVVTLDRIKKITVEPDFEVWKEYANRENIHAAILSYLNLRRENFCRIETTVDGKLFATPRGWEDLSELIGVYEKLGKRVDRDVIGQYIQFPKISKDFANYLELFYKYENDYRVEEILDGHIEEALCDRLAKAAFDEKLSLVGLLLSGLTRSFRELKLTEERMELVMACLKTFEQRIRSGENCGSAYGLLGEITKKFEEETNQKKRAGLLARRDERVRRAALLQLETFARKLRERDLRDGAAAWDWIRGAFGLESDAYEEENERCAQQLEHAFDFMEASFGAGQEMVIFVTELNSNPYCVEFLKEYDCERYYQYNKQLLFDEREDELQARL